MIRKKSKNQLLRTGKVALLMLFTVLWHLSSLAFNLPSAPFQVPQVQAVDCGFGTEIGSTGICRGFLTITGSNQTWTAPADWNNNNNTIECIGGGGSGGASARNNTLTATGGGGGAYSAISNFTVASPGSTEITYRIGAGGSGVTQTDGSTAGNDGGDTWFNDSSFPGSGTTNVHCGAQGGGGGNAGSASQSGGTGGSGSAGWGETRRSGGSGGTADADRVATGGGGAAGDSDVGSDGDSTSSRASVTGGGQANGSGASGGGGGTTGSTGSNGTEYDTQGSGGGGGGGSNNTNGTVNAGNAGASGGGGGGALNYRTGQTTIAVSGDGADGLIVITYSPLQPPITVTGTLYQDNETTPYNCSAAGGITINSTVNGFPGGSDECTSSDGTFSLEIMDPEAANVPIALYIDSTESIKATTVTLSSTGGAGISSLNLFVDRLNLTQQNSTPITNSHLATADDEDDGILYSVSGGNLLVDSDVELHVQDSKTYAPGGNITTQGAGGIHLDDDATLTGSGSQTHTSASTITIDSGAVYTAPTSGSVNASHLVLSGTFTAGGTALTLSGSSGTLFTRTGTYTAGSSTLNVDSASSITVFSADTTVHHLSFNPTLSSAATYTLGAAPTINGNLTINPDGTETGVLTVDASGHIVTASSGLTQISGTGSATSILRLRPASTDYNLTTGNLSITAAGTLNAASSASVITLNGSGTLFSNSGTFVPGNSTVVAATNGSFSLASATTFNNLTVNNTLSTSSSLTINGTLTLSGSGNFSPSGGTTTFATTGWAIANSGTLAFAGLTISETPSVQPSTSFSVSNALTVSSGKTLAPTTGTITIAGGSIVNNGGSSSNLIFQGLSLSGTTSSASSFEVKGNWANSGTFTQSAGTVSFNASGAQQISGTNNTFFGLEITGSRTVTITNGSVLAVADNGSLNLQGVDYSNLLTLTSGGSDWFLRLSTTNTSQAVSYVDASYSNAGGYAEINAANDTNFDSGDNTNWNFGACRWIGSASTAWETGSNWGGCSGTGGVPDTSDSVAIQAGAVYEPTLSTSVTIASLTVNSGTLTIGTGGTLNSTGDIALDGGTLDGDQGSINAGGAWTVTGGSFSPSSSTVTFTNASPSIPAIGFNNLTINTSGTATLQGNLTIAGDLTLSGGTLNLGSNTANRSSSGGTLSLANDTILIIGGSNTLPANYATHSIGSTSTVEYAGTSTTVASLNSSQSYANLVISGSSVTTSASFTVAVALSVTGNLTASSGTITLAGATVANSGTLIFSGLNITDTVTTNSSFQVRGNWANSGTFTQSAGAITFNGTGAQQISGTDNTFKGLAITASSARTVTITPGSVLSVAANGNLTLQGGGGSNLLTLQSGGGDWYLQLDTSGTTQSVSYVSVARSNADGYKEINAFDGTNVDGGDNTNWAFTAPFTTFDFNGLNMEGINIY